MTDLQLDLLNTLATGLIGGIAVALFCRLIIGWVRTVRTQEHDPVSPNHPDNVVRRASRADR